MGLFDGMWRVFAKRIRPFMEIGTADRRKLYFQGQHKKSLKTPLASGYDDNVSLNFVGLVIWRSVSRMLRGGVNWQLPDGASAQKDYLDNLWRVNRKDRVFLQGALHAAVFSTGYWEIVPDGRMDSLTEELYPRVVPLNSEYMKIVTDPDDIDEVERYILEYEYTELDAVGIGTKIRKRKVVRKSKDSDYPKVEGQAVEPQSEWIIEYWIQSKATADQWKLDPNVKPNPQTWVFPFAPIVHWKNLPSIGDCYGISDIDDIGEEDGPQDKVNYAYSNAGKIVRLQAHRQPYVVGMQAPKTNPDGTPTVPVETGPGKMLFFPKETTVGQLDATADIAGASAFAHDLRQAEFDIAREVDSSAIMDKAGALTNFGLRVLSIDALDKTDTKRQLFGEAIEELNHRLLRIKGFNGKDADPGKVIWGDALPTNIIEDMDADQTALGMGIVSKEAVFKRYAERYGVTDWKDMQSQIEDEQTKANANSDNIGAALLRNFNRGGNTAAAQKPEQLMGQGVAQKMMGGNATKPTA